MSYYMIDHPHPKYQQYRTNRRATASGAVMRHITAQAPDLSPPDTGAERVANWIATRRGLAPNEAKYGSYHDLVDADSIIAMAPYNYEVWGSGPKHPSGSGLRSNSIAIHQAAACRHDQWDTLPDWWVAATIDNMAVCAAKASRFIEQLRGYRIPPKRITVAQFWAGSPGFLNHSDIDPDRRKDPGEAFPDDMYLDRFAELTGQATTTTTTFVVRPEWVANMKTIQSGLKTAGHYDDEIDGKYGKNTIDAWHAYNKANVDRQARLSRLAADAGHAADRADETARQLRTAAEAAR